MIIAIGSDEATELTTALWAALEARGHTVLPFGPLAPGDPDSDWPLVASRVARAVASGQADQGIVCCWTGTGASIAANKVPGVRAALCQDAKTAEGARKWNDANVLAMSLRATSPIVAAEILDAWLGSGPEENEKRNIEKISEIEKKYRR